MYGVNFPGWNVRRVFSEGFFPRGLPGGIVLGGCPYPLQDYHSLRVAVTIWIITLVNTHTHTHSFWTVSPLCSKNWAEASLKALSAAKQILSAGSVGNRKAQIGERRDAKEKRCLVALILVVSNKVCNQQSLKPVWQADTPVIARTVYVKNH